MREIKFRVYDEQTKKMWYSDGNVLPLKSLTFTSNSIYAEGTSGYDPTVKYLMQYTGLKDKNEKEIYEGDIVKYESCDICSNCNFRVKMFAEVIWDNASSEYLILNKEGCSAFCMYDIDIEFEVVGNIYENSELIE